jgi:hypothetical protein
MYVSLLSFWDGLLVYFLYKLCFFAVCEFAIILVLGSSQFIYWDDWDLRGLGNREQKKGL